jgi:hypothetical protein
MKIHETYQTSVRASRLLPSFLVVGPLNGPRVGEKGRVGIIQRGGDGGSVCDGPRDGDVRGRGVDDRSERASEIAVIEITYGVSVERI